MRRYLLPILLGLVSLLVPELAKAQITTVSATIVDGAGQVLAGGTYKFSSTAVGQVPIGGSLDSGGSFAGVVIPHNPATQLVNDYWTVTICPDATFACGTSFIQITGANLDLTTLISPISTISITIPPAPAPVTALRAYSDSEISTTPKGGAYFNVLLNAVRTCTALTGNPAGPNAIGTCTAWASSSGSGGSVGPGTATNVSCFNGLTTIGNCNAPITSTSGNGGTVNIGANTVNIGNGTGPTSFGLPSGNISGCVAPAPGFDNICAVSDDFYKSINNGAYVPLSGSTAAWSSLTAGTNSNAGTFTAVGNNWDFSAASSFIVPIGSAAAPTANGSIAFNSGSAEYVAGVGGTSYILPTSLPGSVGQPVVYTSQSSLDNAPLYIAVDGVQGGGIGQASVSWVAATTYPLCQLVSNSGNYIATGVNNGSTTPGTNSHIWYPIPNASRPTQFDCAFYIAQSLVTSTVGANLQVGMGIYNSCIGMSYPTVGGAGQPGVNIHGVGLITSIIKQTCPLLAGSGGDGLAMLNLPVAGTAFFLPTLQFSDFTLDGQAIVPSIADFHACQQCSWENIAFNNPTPGQDHAVEFGTIGGGSTGWVFEANIKNLQIAYNPSVTGFGHGNNNATFTVAVTAGVPAITVTAGGTGYDAGQLTVRLVKAGGLNACSSVGTNTPTVASGVITAITSTATGCATTGNTFVQLYPQINVAYGFKFSNMSDSHNVGSLAVGGVGATCGVFTNNVNAMNDYTKIHPVNTFDGLCVNGSEDFYGTQIDSVYNHGINIGSSFNIMNFYGSKFEWNGNNYQGSSDWYFLTTVNPPVNSAASISIWGESCGDTPHQSGYGHFVNAASGVIDAGAAMPPRVTAHDPVYCNQYTTSTATLANIVAPTYSWSGGQFGNVWTWNLGSGASTNLPLTNSSDTATSPFSHFLDAHVAATSGQNANSPSFGAHGNYWNGSASVQYGWQVQTTFAAGSGPLATHAFQGAGTAPAAGDTWTFDGPVTLPAGSTATTQSPGDSTTKVATTAFVAAASHSPIFTTPSAATAANISSVTMTSGTTGVHAYFFQWSISLTAVGVACTGSTTLRLNAVYQDPNGAGSNSSSQFISSTSTGSLPSTATITIANTGNGVLGQVGSGGSFIVSAASTTVQYNTSNYTAGANCTTNPTYQIFPSLVQVY